MQRLLLLLLFCSIFLSTSAQQKDIDELTNLNQRWLNAYSKKDRATMNEIFADDFVLISPTGNKMKKQDVINNLDNQETMSIKVDSIEVKLLTPDVGLVTAYISFVVKAEGKQFTGSNCYQDVYIKRKSRWWAVAAHVTSLSMK